VYFGRRVTTWPNSPAEQLDHDNSDHPICLISFLIDAVVAAGSEVKITNDTTERIRKRSWMTVKLRLLIHRCLFACLPAWRRRRQQRLLLVIAAQFWWYLVDCWCRQGVEIARCRQLAGRTSSAETARNIAAGGRAARVYRSQSYIDCLCI